MENRDNTCTVLVISSNYPRFPRDTCGWFIHEISHRITKIGYRVIALSPHTHNSKVHEIIDGVNINRFRYFFPSGFERLAYGSGVLYNLKKDPLTVLSILPFIVLEFFQTCRIVQRNHVDVIHSHWLLPQGMVGTLVHLISGIPHVATIHGSDINLIKQHRLLHPLAMFIVKSTEVVTVNSTYTKQVLESIVPGCEKKIRVIPMGIDPEKFRTTNSKKKSPGSEHRILSVGRLINWKGTIYLLDAMQQVLRQYSNVILIIVGTGPEEKVLRSRARELGIEDFIRFAGSVSPEELMSHYRSADVFVLPSINIEGRTEALGVVLLEAMAAGCPVIGSNVGGIPDIIQDGETGFLVPERDPKAIADKIIRIFSDEELRKQFRENGLRRIRDNFSWETISLQFSDVYNEVLVHPSGNND